MRLPEDAPIPESLRSTAMWAFDTVGYPIDTFDRPAQDAMIRLWEDYTADGTDFGTSVLLVVGVVADAHAAKKLAT